MHERAVVMAMVVLVVSLSGCWFRECGVYRYGVVGELSETQLVAKLKRGDAEARAAAARSLGALGAKAKSAVPALKEALNDTNEIVRRDAAEALKRIESAS